MKHFPEWHELSTAAREEVLSTAEVCSSDLETGAVRSIEELRPYIESFSGPARAALLRTIVWEHVHTTKQLQGNLPDKSAYARVFNCPSDIKVIDDVFAEELPDLRAELVREIGRGGMGVVYEAKQPQLYDRPVAVKTLHSADTRDAFILDGLRAEARALSALCHRNIIAIHDVGILNGQVAFCMDLAAHSLKEEGPKNAPKDQRWTARMVRDIARAIQAAHDEGLIHQDLKPSNVLVMDDGTLKVSDFGLSRMSGHRSVDVSSDRSVGTPGYLSPEQAAGQSVDHRTDIWGLGVILYFLLTSRPPFPVDRGRLRDVCTQAIPSPRKTRTECGGDRLDDRLESIAAKCLKKDPEARFQSASEVDQALRRYLHNEEIDTLAGSLGWRHRLRAVARQNRFTAGSVLAIAVIICTALFILIPQGNASTAKLEISKFRSPYAKTWDEFPWEQNDLFSKSYLQLQPTPGRYKYVLAFDGRDTASIHDEAAMEKELWQWKLTGPRVDTVILLVTEEPLSDEQTKKLIKDVGLTINQHNIQPGTRVQWGNGSYWLEKTGTRPRGQPRRAPSNVSWATRVTDLLNKIEGLQFHGWTFRISEHVP